MLRKLPMLSLVKPREAFLMMEEPFHYHAVTLQNINQLAKTILIVTQSQY